MASELIGRTACPECGFHAAHVKIKTDKEGAHPYRHCPECGAQYFPRNKQQADDLRAKLRAEKAAPDTPPASEAGTPAGPAAETTPPASPDDSRPYKTIFGVRVYES
jgi:hypothetical protein